MFPFGPCSLTGRSIEQCPPGFVPVDPQQLGTAGPIPVLLGWPKHPHQGGESKRENSACEFSWCHPVWPLGRGFWGAHRQRLKVGGATAPAHSHGWYFSRTCRAPGRAAGPWWQLAAVGRRELARVQAGSSQRGLRSLPFAFLP